MTNEQLPAPHIMVVDDDLYLLAAIEQNLMLSGYTVETFGNPLEALARLEPTSFSAVLADIRMPEMDGMTLLSRMLEKDPDLPVILITGHGDISMAVEAVKKGAYNFLQKPVDEDVILATLSRAIERRQLVLNNRLLERQLLAAREGCSRFCGLVGSHPVMLGLYSLIETVARETDPVLISGETGTGKELVARAIHTLGLHSDAPYVAVNMAAIPAEMIESELFGHEKGAFTGAIQRKIGKFEFAGEGTLFLDEICSMPAPLQAKLLRVLEDRTFSRLGGNSPIPLQARIIAATNRDLPAEIKRGTFRQDLYFRLNVLPVQLPPLRERREDIPLLVEYFRHEYFDGRAEKATPCPQELLQQLTQRDWPGNIRELRNVVRRCCVLGDPVPAGPESSLSVPIQSAASESVCQPWKEYMEQQERQYLEQVLRQVNGQVSAAHQMMGISRKSLYDKINKYNLDLAPLRRDSGSGAD